MSLLAIIALWVANSLVTRSFPVADCRHRRLIAMPEEAPSAYHVTLADEVTSGQVTVLLEAYADYCVRMELDLQLLEERFAAFAAPLALSARRQTR